MCIRVSSFCRRSPPQVMGTTIFPRALGSARARSIVGMHTPTAAGVTALTSISQTSSRSFARTAICPKTGRVARFAPERRLRTQRPTRRAAPRARLADLTRDRLAVVFHHLTMCVREQPRTPYGGTTRASAASPVAHDAPRRPGTVSRHVSAPMRPMGRVNRGWRLRLARVLL